VSGINFVKLVAKLFADTSEFEKGLKSATRKSREFRQDVVKVFSTAAKYVAGLGTAFAFLVGKQSIAGDEIGKISQKFGVSAEALSTLDHAANLAGVSTEELAKSFKFMNSALVDAAGGSKEQIAAFATLGLSFKELSQLSPEDAFIKIGDAIAGIESPALKSALATKIFGKAGADLIPLFNLGAEKLKLAKEEAERFGLSINNVDASNLEAMNDSISKIGSAASGVARQFAIGLSPSIAGIVENLLSGVDVADSFRKAGEFIGKVFTTAFDAIKLGQDRVIIGFKDAEIAARDFIMATKEKLGFETEEEMQKRNSVMIERNKIAQEYNAIKKQEIGFTASANNIEKSSQISAKKQKPIGDISEILDAAKKTSEAMDEYKKKLKDAQEEQQKWNDATADSFIGIKDAMLQGGKAADVFRNIAMRALNDIANSVIKASFNATNAGGGGLFGGIGSSISGFFGKGIGSLFSSFLPSFDVGSDYVPKDMTANIHKGEMIIPAREAAQIRSGGMSNGATVIQNITIGSGVSAAVRQEVAKMLPDLKKAAIDGVKDARMRGNNI